MTIFRNGELQSMDHQYRLHLLNSVTGYKSANLIGTRSKSGVTNLAVVSSVTHISSNPPIVGYFVRAGDDPPDTFENIINTKSYTVNHISTNLIKKAHQTSAKYDSDLSEFEIAGFTEEYSETIFAPFVAESRIKMGLEFRNRYPISESGTVLIIGEIVEVRIPEEFISDDGHIYLHKANTVTISGLDAYHLPKLLHRFSHAKPESTLEVIE